MKDKFKDSLMYKICNKAYYAYRRNLWMLHPSIYYKNFRDVKINKPIFLLGVQGGGITLVSRILRRNPKAVSVTGNCNYWYGADEMQNVFSPVLPPELTGISYKAPHDKMFGTPRGSLYATDRLITKYRNEAGDVTTETKERLQKIIRWVIAKHSDNRDSARFIDKSQLYTVKLSFINEILKDCQPKFVLVTRNPYALCYRSAQGKAYSIKKISNRFDFSQRLSFVAQHWANSIKYVLGDSSNLENFKIIRFEDFLLNPKQKIKELCDFIELQYFEDMLPQSKHRIGLGNKSSNKWYPLRPNTNDKYIAEMSKADVDVVNKYCFSYAERLGYVKPIKE